MRRLTIYASILLLSLSLPVKVSPVWRLLQTEGKWERYTGKGESFTVSLPERPTAVMTYRPARFIDFRSSESYRGTLYSTYSEGVAYLIYSFPRRSEPLKQIINEFASRYSSIQVVSARRFSPSLSALLPVPS